MNPEITKVFLAALLNEIGITNMTLMLTMTKVDDAHSSELKDLSQIVRVKDQPILERPQCAFLGDITKDRRQDVKSHPRNVAEEAANVDNE